jgi:AraC-like DNA-binding protein
MGRPVLEPPSPSPMPPAIVRYLRTRGIDVSSLLERFELPGDTDARDTAPITARGLNELIDAASLLLNEPHLALRLPAELSFARYGLAELVARSSATLRDAFNMMSRYAGLIHSALEITFEEQGDEARMSHRTRGHARGIGRHMHEYGLAKAMHSTRTECGRHVVARRVWFMHARPPDLTSLERFFGTDDLSFGRADNGMALDASVLDLPMLGQDPRMLATVAPLAEAALQARPPVEDFAARVAVQLRQLLPDGARMDAVARALHMSERTLQRRLEQSGTRFSDVLDGVRESLARTLVADRAITLADISYRLGFSDLPTFSRAFKRWTGKPPGTFRRGTAAD